MDPVTRVPGWLLRLLPTNARVNDALHARIDKIAAKLPGSLAELDTTLDGFKSDATYDAAANRAAAHVWLVLDQISDNPTPQVARALLHFAHGHLVPQAQARILRRLVKSRDTNIRTQARGMLLASSIREVALPNKREGDWDQSGWTAGTDAGRLARHKQGKRVQEAHKVPVLTNIKQLRELLGIKSPNQLGFLLLASDKKDGPYTTFTIPKRDGSNREICAPKAQLRYYQRQILKHILTPIQPHDAAHGFVPGRSTVTNAAKHQGAELLLKFDLKDFFPTIHYFRLMGFFASLGYYVENGTFQSADDARNVAPTLARLCSYTPDPKRWGIAIMPQGAPTSPALSNLVCRRLDARLTGLATRNEGVYTRYADDLTFSFKIDKLNVGRFRWWVDQICHQEGFLIHQSKFRVVRGSQRQTVTGIVVNDVLRIPREARRRFRAILHNCRTQGVESQAQGKHGFTDYLRGFASYIHMVHPEEGLELLKQVETLLGPDEPGDDQ